MQRQVIIKLKKCKEKFKIFKLKKEPSNSNSEFMSGKKQANTFYLGMQVKTQAEASSESVRSECQSEG